MGLKFENCSRVNTEMYTPMKWRWNSLNHRFSLQWLLNVALKSSMWTDYLSLLIDTAISDLHYLHFWLTFSGQSFSYHFLSSFFFFNIDHKSNFIKSIWDVIWQKNMLGERSRSRSPVLTHIWVPVVFPNCSLTVHSSLVLFLLFTWIVRYIV